MQIGTSVAVDTEFDRVRRHFAALERILAALDSGDDLPTTLDHIAAAVAAALGADDAWFLLDGTPTAPTAIPASLPQDEPRPAATAPPPDRLVVPLLRAGQSFGALQIALGRDATSCDDEDTAFARRIAGHAVVAIERARREAEARRRADRAEMLREIGRVLSAELDFDRFLAVAREQIARIIDYGSGWLALWDEAAQELDCRLYIADGERLPELELRLQRGTGLAWVLIEERRTLNTPDYLDECRRRGLRPTGRGDEPRTTTNPWLGLPLVAGGRLIGLLALQRLGESFTEEEATTLELLSGQLAAALENARCFTEARQLASCDPLTGLANHRALQERLDAELARAARSGQPLTAIMVDLDNFKLFNDTYGHPVGDEVLRLVASVLHTEARASDIVGRYGGDEFLILLPGEEAVGALAYLDRVRERIARHHPSLGETSAIPLAVSSGIAVYPHDARHRNDLIALADSALYTSKRGGGHTVVTAGGRAGSLDLAAHTGFGVVEGLVLAVDTKDQYTVEHSAVVAEAAVCLGEALGLTERELAILRTAGLLHDVGKVSIPDRILRKPGRLSREEWAVMRQHVEFGELIIRGVPSLDQILEPIMHHHERWDGEGYPRGLAGEAVPLLGRIMIVADAYSAMILDRPYRRGLSTAEALAQLRAGAGRQFDPDLVPLFCTVVEQRAAPRLSIAS